MPHFSLTTTGLPVRSIRNGFGLIGTPAIVVRLLGKSAAVFRVIASSVS